MNRDKERELELANMKIAVELGKIRGKILDYIKKDLYLLEFYDEWFREAKAKGEDIRHEDKSAALKQTQENLADIFDTVILVSKIYIDKSAEGETKPDIKNLNLLEVNCREVLENIDLFHENFPQTIDSKKVVETKKGIKFAQEKVIPVVREFAYIHERQRDLDKTNFTWQKVKELWQEAKKAAEINRSEKILAEIAENQKNNFLGEITFEAIDFVKAVNEGEDFPSNALPSTHEELNFLQEIADNFPNLLRWAEKKFSKEISEDPAKWQEIKTENEKLKSFIQQQRKKLGSSKRPTNKPNPQDQQKIQSQEKEIELLKQQLTELTKQIEEMKKNKTNLTDQTAGQEVIEKLEEKKQEVKTQLEKKQSSQKELKDKVEAQINQPDNKFNWLYVVIPGGILLVIAGIAIAYLVGKKNKRE